MKKFTILLILTLSSLFLASCGGWNPKSARDVPVSGPERAKKNIAEGRGVSLKNLGRGSQGTNYEFSTSNPMWRAAFDVIDFMPLTTVDYSGGTIITDWYTDNRSPNEALKFTIRFLSSEVRADSLKIIIHRKICTQKSSCVIKKISSKLEDEVRTAIVKKAAILEKESRNKKGNKREKEDKKKKGFFGFGKDKK
tara:strand:+ start:236 stop:820 length:585 start_codon:yes stop_codon:yes gene_type:complete